MSNPISLGIYVLDVKGWRNPTPREVYDLVEHSEPSSISYDPSDSEFCVSEKFDEEEDETYWEVSNGREGGAAVRFEDSEEAFEFCVNMNLEHDLLGGSWDQDDFISNGFTWHEIEDDLSAWAKRIHFNVMADIRYDDNGALQRLYARADGTSEWISPYIVWPGVDGFPDFESEE